MASCCVTDTSCKKNVCINVPKIFDQCRLQVCLTREDIGPARLFVGSQPSCGCHDSSNSCSPTHVVPPPNAVSVTINDFCIKNISILNKEPNKLRPCFWDITVKFTFLYNLKFHDAEGCEISCVRAFNTFTTTVSLFAGDDINTAVLNELYRGITSNGPFAAVEASAIGLSAELNFRNNCSNGCGCFVCCPSDCMQMCSQSCDCRNDCDCRNNCRNDCDCRNNCRNDCDCRNNSCRNDCDCRNNSCGCTRSDAAPDSVNVTIGLFAVIKLLRLSNLCVETCGNCMPDECESISGGASVDPCEFFNSLEFPIDLFAPQTNYTPVPDTAGNTSTPNGFCC